MRKKIWEDIIVGCAPIAAGFILATLFCLLVAMCSCKPTQRVVEVERWMHDTTTVTDTVRIKEAVVIHDSIFKTEYITQWVKDSTQKNEAWKYYTYDKDGNVSSLLDYTSSTHHGKSTNTASQNAQTSVSEGASVHEETSGHNESVGHTEKVEAKEQAKVGLTRWQRLIQGLGYTFLVLLVLGLGLGGLRLYGKYKRL